MFVGAIEDQIAVEIEMNVIHVYADSGVFYQCLSLAISL